MSYLLSLKKLSYLSLKFLQMVNTVLSSFCSLPHNIYFNKLKYGKGIKCSSCSSTVYPVTVILFNRSSTSSEIYKIQIIILN